MCTGAEPLMFMAVNAGMQAGTAYNNSRSTRDAYNAQGQIAANNAQVAEWRAQDAESRGEQAVYATRLKTAQFKGTQRARMAANGVDLTTGSPLEILTDTDYFGEIDRARITDNAAREAWGYRTEGQNFQGDASLLRSRAAAESPLMAGATSLLSSASRVDKSWLSGGSSMPAGTRATFNSVDYFKRGDY